MLDLPWEKKNKKKTLTHLKSHATLVSANPEKKKSDCMEIMLKWWLQNFTVFSEVLLYFLGWEESQINVCLFCVFVCLSVCLFIQLLSSSVVFIN